MSVNGAVMTNKTRRSKALSLLIMVLFTLSTISLPACSGNDNHTVSQRVVLATVSFDDEGPVATAWVRDVDQNFVYDAVLTINDRPFELVSSGEEAADEDSIPYFYLELHDLRGGDSLTLVAKRSDGTLIYRPPSAQIPMPIELVEPESDQTIVPGEEVVVRWVGGEGGSHIAAFYADDLGEEQYLDVQKNGDVEAITIPAGVIRAGGGVIGAAALSGHHTLFETNANTGTRESSFVIYRGAGDHVLGDHESLGSHAASCPPNQKKGQSGACCPNSPVTGHTAKALCTAEIIAVIGLAVWTTRYLLDRKSYPPCRPGGGGIMAPAFYCMEYSMNYSHYKWARGCRCPDPN